VEALTHEVLRWKAAAQDELAGLSTSIAMRHTLQLYRYETHTPPLSL